MNREDLRTDFEDFLQTKINIEKMVDEFEKENKLLKSESNYLKKLQITFLLLKEVKK